MYSWLIVFVFMKTCLFCIHIVIWIYNIYLFMADRLGSYDTTLIQKHIYEKSQFVSATATTLCHVRPSDPATGLPTAADRPSSHWKGCHPGNACLPSQGPTGSVAQCSPLADAAHDRDTSVGSFEQPVPSCTHNICTYNTCIIPGFWHPFQLFLLFIYCTDMYESWNKPIVLYCIVFGEWKVHVGRKYGVQ